MVENYMTTEECDKRHSQKIRRIVIAVSIILPLLVLSLGFLAYAERSQSNDIDESEREIAKVKIAQTRINTLQITVLEDVAEIKIEQKEASKKLDDILRAVNGH